jgi:hypothetical protein
MPFDSPFPLGPFLVDPSGRLSPTGEGVFPAFRLLWRDQAVQVAMARRLGDVGTLVLDLPAGRVGSTAGDAPARSQQRREVVFAALRAVASLMPPGWRLALGADHGVRLLAEVPLAMPASATDLISQVTLSLLAASPYLDVLAEAGVEAGRAKTCPG